MRRPDSPRSFRDSPSGPPSGSLLGFDRAGVRASRELRHHHRRRQYRDGERQRRSPHDVCRAGDRQRRLGELDDTGPCGLTLERNRPPYGYDSRQQNPWCASSKRTQGVAARGPWGHSTVRSILLNTRYMGEWKWNVRQWVRIAGKKSKKALRRSAEEVTTRVYPHLAIVDAELWARVKPGSLNGRTQERAGRPALARCRTRSRDSSAAACAATRCES